MPLCLGASGSVRQASQIQSAFWALEVKTFCPSTSHSPHRSPHVPDRRSPPAATAAFSGLLVRRHRHPHGPGPQRGQIRPADGSLYPMANTSSPRRIRGRK